MVRQRDLQETTRFTGEATLVLLHTYNDYLAILSFYSRCLSLPRCGEPNFESIEMYLLVLVHELKVFHAVML